MEFKVVTVRRSLDLSQNYAPVEVGTLKIGLQTISDDVAEIEVQGPEGMDRLSIPIATAATCQGYTIINRDVGLMLPNEKKRRRWFGRKDNTPKDGIMETLLDVRWGDQSMQMSEPQKDIAHDFMLVRQYEVVNDRPMVYQNQDKIQFGDLYIEIGDRVEEGSRNWKKPRQAEFLVSHQAGEPEAWQVKINGRYHNKEGYRVRITSYDFYNEWYQAYAISIVHGQPKEYMEETEEVIGDGIVAEAHVGHTESMSLSKSRLDEAEANPNEAILKVGDSKNVGRVGIKLLEMRPGQVQVMLLSPKVKKTTLVHGEVFDFGRYDISLVGIHGEKAIIRVVED